MPILAQDTYRHREGLGRGPTSVEMMLGGFARLSPDWALVERKTSFLGLDIGNLFPGDPVQR